MASIYPTPEAWEYFMKHKDDIRGVIEDYCPSPQMQSMAGPSQMDQRYTLADFDAAVESKDTSTLCSIMNDAWLRAPESRNVYSVPGFTQMCNLLDCTVDGFFGDEEEPAT